MSAKKSKKLGIVAIGAAKTGQDQFIDFLMMAGVSPDLKCAEGKTLAYHAAEFAVMTGNAEILRKLVRYGANLYIKAKNGKTIIDVLKANPKLENEVRVAWLRGSHRLGVKDSIRGRDGDVLWGENEGNTKRKTKQGGDIGRAEDVLGKVRVLRGNGEKKHSVLRRPEVERDEDASISTEEIQLFKKH